MKNDRRFRAPAVLVTLAAVGLGTTAGCGMLNPSLVAAIGANPVQALDAPEGALVILVMNRSDSIAAARIRVTKDNEGTVELVVPVGAFGVGTEPDHAAVVQDCDVTTIELLGVTAEGGIEIPSFSPPLRDGFELSCGKVVSILILGTGIEPLVYVR